MKTTMICAWLMSTAAGLSTSAEPSAPPRPQGLEAAQKTCLSVEGAPVVLHRDEPAFQSRVQALNAELDAIARQGTLLGITWGVAYRLPATATYVSTEFSYSVCGYESPASLAPATRCTFLDCRASGLMDVDFPIGARMTTTACAGNIRSELGHERLASGWAVVSFKEGLVDNCELPAA